MAIPMPPPPFIPYQVGGGRRTREYSGGESAALGVAQGLERGVASGLDAYFKSQLAALQREDQAFRQGLETDKFGETARHNTEVEGIQKQGVENTEKYRTGVLANKGAALEQKTTQAQLDRTLAGRRAVIERIQAQGRAVKPENEGLLNTYLTDPSASYADEVVGTWFGDDPNAAANVAKIRNAGRTPRTPPAPKPPPLKPLEGDTGALTRAGDVVRDAEGEAASGISAKIMLDPKYVDRAKRSAQRTALGSFVKVFNDARTQEINNRRAGSPVSLTSPQAMLGALRAQISGAGLGDLSSTFKAPVDDSEEAGDTALATNIKILVDAGIPEADAEALALEITTALEGAARQ